jgi:ribosomal protein L11 methyltransferase
MTQLAHIFRLTLVVARGTASTFATALEQHVDSVAWTAREGFPHDQVTGFAEGPPDAAAVTAAIEVAAAAENLPAPAIEIEQIPVRDWVLDNIEQFPPTRVGRFVVYGQEEDAPNVPDIGLMIPAGGAFGSGDHGSTAGCLTALDQLRGERFERALDMGCGSGILAVAIAKKWHIPVLASDIDPTSQRITTENAARNGVARWVRAVQARGYGHPAVNANTYDLIASNILSRPLTFMSRYLGRRLRPGGIAILSGLIEDDYGWVLTAHQSHGLHLVRRIVINGWVTLVMRKNG